VRVRGGDNGGLGEEGHNDGSSGGRAERTEPAGAELCPRNRRGVRGRGGDNHGHGAEGRGDGSSGGRAGRTEPARAAPVKTYQRELTLLLFPLSSFFTIPPPP
jgi:hypothetical protein